MTPVFELTINGVATKVDAGLTVQELVQFVAPQGRSFAIAVNRRFIPREEYSTFVLKADDEIEILTPMQGG